jgi:mRNA-degrading endonuclease toxin of MazEF toxin-antitoxin module
MARHRSPKVDRPRQGSIVYTGTLDSLGNNYKDRTVLLVSHDDGSETFDGIAITRNTQLSPPDHQVALDHSHPLTNLTAACVAVCTWPVEVDVSRIRRIVGRLPMANLEQVLERIKELRDKGVIQGADSQVTDSTEPPS